MNKLRSLLLFCSIFGVICLQSSSDSWAAAPGTPKVEHWSQVLDGQNLDRLDQLGDRISDIIFDGIDDIGIFKFTGSSFGVDLSIHRRVFDNEDVLNSWTVVDRFDVAGSVPIYSETLTSLGNLSPINFNLGTDLGMEFVNIRRVTPSEFRSFPTVEARKTELENEPWYQEFSQGQKPASADEKKGQWLFSQNDSDKGTLTFFPRDPETEARYSKFYNLVVFPFRLPLKASVVQKMGDGEIVSYLGYGGLQVGGSVGWNLDPTMISEVVNTTFSLSTFVRGTFRISVMKEDKNFVRVKATRIGTVGASVSLGGSAKPSILDGIIILKDLQRELKIIPFNMNVGTSLAKSFDIGYRYNLSIPGAREAYEQAVIGRLALSDELAIDKNGKPTDFSLTGVQKTFTREALTKTASNSTGLRIGFVFKHDNVSTVSDVDAIVTLPDGTKHLLFANVVNRKAWSLFWGTYERLQNNFTISLDLGKLAATGLDDSLSLLAEGRIEDSDTHDGEILEYELTVENSVGKPQIFPRLPKAQGNLGRSHFYYRMALDARQIEKFVHIPEEEMWTHLENAFHVAKGAWSSTMSRMTYRATNSLFSLLNIPLYVAGVNLRAGSDLWHADTIRTRWINLSTIKDPKIRVEALGRMFFDKYYGYELTYLLRSVLDGEKISFYVTGYSPIFGRIVDQGGSALSFDDISTKIQRKIDYDLPGPRPPDGDTSATVNEFIAHQLDADRIELRLTLQKEPIAVYLQLLQSNWWWPFHNGKKGDLLIRNTGQFHAGENILILDRSDTSSAFYELAQHLEATNRYRMALAVNNDNLHWGAIATTRITFRQIDQKIP